LGTNSKISWTDHTFNPWIGCTNVSPGCDNCYAEELMDKRYGRVQWGPHGTRVRTSPTNWKLPLKWAREAVGRPRVFCASLADILDNQASQEWRADLWDLVRATPQLDWLFLTKRPQNFSMMAPSAWWRDGCPPNVWWGISVENQEELVRRGHWLNQIEARVKFWSCEPLLGPLDTSLYPPPYRDGCPDVDWVICGGESGPKSRLMQPEWARVLRNEVQAAGAAFFFKQTGSKTWGGLRRGKGDDPAHWPPDLKVQDFPEPREWPWAV
jgi:protein gp37